MERENEVRKLFEQFAGICEAYDLSDDDLGWLALMYVAETDSAESFRDMLGNMGQRGVDRFLGRAPFADEEPEGEEPRMRHSFISKRATSPVEPVDEPQCAMACEDCGQTASIARAHANLCTVFCPGCGGVLQPA